MIEVCMLVKVTRLMVFLTSGPCISCHWLLVFPFHVSRLTFDGFSLPWGKK